MIKSRIDAAHARVVLREQLAITAAALVDLGMTEIEPLHLTDMQRIVIDQVGDELSCIFKSVNYFNMTYQKVDISKELNTNKLAYYPNLLKQLVEHGYWPAGNKIQHKNIPSPSPSLAQSKLFLGPELGISYGSYNYLFSYLIYSLLIENRRILEIWGSSVIPEICPFFKKLVNYNDGVNHVLIDKMQISSRQLIEYGLGGGVDSSMETIYKELYNAYRIESDRHYSTSNSKTKENRKSSKPILNIIQHQIGKRTTKLVRGTESDLCKKLLSVNRPLICIANRDPLWVGDGQPWRDDPIENYDCIIRYLEQRGYIIVRLNSVGIRSNYISNSFIDLAGTNINQAEQILIASRAQFMIGTSSGICDIPRVALGVPNLLLNGATCQVNMALGHVVHCPKVIRIVNQSKLQRSTICRLSSLICRNMWTNQIMEEFGLTLEFLDTRSRLEALEEFILKGRNYVECNNLYSLFAKYEIKPMGPNQYLSKSTAENLGALITKYLEGQSSFI
jgi:putative glycosyltransferase (TIGR04372 family)